MQLAHSTKRIEGQQPSAPGPIERKVYTYHMLRVMEVKEMVGKGLVLGLEQGLEQGLELELVQILLH